MPAACPRHGGLLAPRMYAFESGHRQAMGRSPLQGSLYGGLMVSPLLSSLLPVGSGLVLPGEQDL